MKKSAVFLLGSTFFSIPCENHDSGEDGMCEDAKRLATVLGVDFMHLDDAPPSPQA